MSVEEIQGYLLILSPLAMSIVAMSIFTLQDKNIKTYRLGEIAKDRNPKPQDKKMKTYKLGDIAKDRNSTPKKQKGVFDMQGTVKYTKGDNT